LDGEMSEKSVLKLKTGKFNFKDTIFSHGWVFLEPYYWDNKSESLGLILKLKNSKLSQTRISFKNKVLIIKIEVTGGSLDAGDKDKIKKTVRHIFRLDEDLNRFYAICNKDPELEFVCKNQCGRLLRSPSIYEDMVKTICTTNCSWSNTVSMVSNLCKLEAGCFPAPETIVKTGAIKLKEFCRVGYRAEPIYELSKAVFEKEFDPDSLLKEKNIEETRKRLMAFNGIGKYSASHILMLAGHYSDVPIDSEVTSYIEETYFSGLKVSEKEIFDLFEKYGEWKYLVFKYKRIGRKRGSKNRI
jgi:3-methyladenine DNA glycosylase/8-oxoguanine DNA glycosylase